MESTDRDDSEPVAVLQDYVPVVCDRESGDGGNSRPGGDYCQGCLDWHGPQDEAHHHTSIMVFVCVGCA